MQTARSHAGAKGSRARFQRWCAVLVLAVLPTWAWAADPQIASVTDSPDPVPAGSLYTYTLRVDNNAGDAAVNARLRLSVPSGATFVSAAPASQNCVATSATQVDCNLGTVGPDGADVRSIVMTWRATGPGPATISATALLTADNDVNASNNTQTAITTVTNGADLTLTSTASPEPVIAGANVTYTLSASNLGPNPSDAIVITDTLSPSVSYVSATGAGWSCSHAAGTVTCTRPGPHAVGASIPAVTLVATMNASSGTVTNTASVAPAASGTPDPDNGNNTSTVNSSIVAGADLRIVQKSVISAVPAVAGNNVSFLIQARNAGPSLASTVSVTDNLPAGWTYVSASGPNWTCSAAAQTVTCTRPSLSSSAADDITVVARAPDSATVGSGATYVNTAQIGSPTPDPVAANNSGSVSVSVLPDGADLRLSKTKSPNPVALGSALTSTLIVTNNGPRTATGPLRVVDLLANETYSTFAGTGWSCALTGATVVCNHANAAGLPVGASLPTLTLVTIATASGSVVNTACTGGSVPAGAGGAAASPPSESDRNTGNDCASAGSVSTVVRPDLSISKTTSTPTGGDKIVSTSESSVTYTLVVTNASATAENATGVRIVDSVPGYITGSTTITSPIVAVASAASTATFNCTVSGPTVVCTQTGGVLAQGQTVTVPITVNRPLADGTFTNLASVSNTVEGDPNSANDAASDTVTIAPIADVELTGKSVSPSPVRAGEAATYVISFRNNGPSTAAGVVITDTMTFTPGDRGATVLSIASSKPGSSCSLAAGAQLTPAANAFSCTVGSMANGETQTVTLVLRPNWQPGNPVRSFGNTAAVTTTSVENAGGGDNGNNSKTATLAVNGAAVDLLVNKVDLVDPVPYTAGATFINYQVRVNSNGPSFATGVSITEAVTPPPGRRIRFVCDTTVAGGAACNAPSLCSATNVTSAAGAALPGFTCQVPAGTATTGPAVGELASGQFKDIFLRFEVLDEPAPRGDVFNNVATVAANEPDTLSANDADAEVTTVRQRIDLRLTKVASVATAALRQPFNWVVTVANNGPANSLQTDVTDTLPAGTEVTGPITWVRSLQAGSGTCALAGQVVSCAIGQLDANGRATITIPVRMTSVPAGGVASNSATLDTDPNKTGAIDTPGGNNTGVGTVAITTSSLAGTVFEDRDRSTGNAGVPQAAAAEPRIAGVNVRLTGTDAFGNPVDRIAVTDAAGNYRFDDLSPSDAAGYTLTQTQPSGFANGPASPPTSGASAPSAGGSYAAGGLVGNSSYGAIVIGASTAAVNYHFAEVRQPSLSGLVYLDVNGNGVRDAGDSPIAGTTVRLLDAGTLALIATATTDAAGAYRFTGLDPLRPYTLEQPLPAAPAGLLSAGVNVGLIDGAPCAGGCAAQPATPTAGTDRITAIDLSSGTDGTQFNFGEIQPAGLSGKVFLDLDDNGLQNLASELGLGGVTLTITGTDDTGAPVNRTVVTAADGSYSLTDLRPGTYSVTQPAQPAGTVNGKTTPGSAGGSATPQATTPSAISGIVLATTGSVSTGNNFAEIPNNSQLGGRVWTDTNNNGTIDGTEAGIAGVTLQLTGTDIAGRAVTRTTTTDASGNYRFDNLAPGTYTVTQPTQPAGTVNGLTLPGTGGGTATAVNTTPSAIAGITLGGGQTVTGNNFAELPGARIGGQVYADNNNNGVADAGETGLSGVTIVLTGTDDLGNAVNITVTTGADGKFSFPDLRPGTYTLTEPAQPAGTVAGQTSAGAAGGSATPVGAGPSTIAGIVLPIGGDAGGYNFGEIAFSPDLRVRKTHSDAALTVGKTATYRISVRNVGESATAGAYTVEDRLPAGLTLAAAPTGAGWSCTGAVGASRLSCSASATINAGANGASDITVVVNVTAAALAASPVSNVALVDGGGEIDARRPTAAERDAFDNNPGALPLCTPAIDHNACRDAAPVQLPASMSGTVWYDVGSTARVLDSGDRRMSGWIVEVVDAATGAIVARSTTAADGSYRIAELVAGVPYAVRFRDPQSNVVFGYPVNGDTAPGSSGVACATGTPPAGTASSCVGSGAAPQLTVVLAPGQHLPQQSLPIDPSGVVYDSAFRQPVAGAVVTLAPAGACAGWNPSTGIVGATLGGYTIAGDSVSMTVGDDGLYQYLLAPAAPANCTFNLTVAPPPTYTFVSRAIPPTAGPLVPTGGAGSVYNVQPQATAPSGAVGTATTYFLTLSTGSAGANVLHNHIPLDPSQPVVVTLTKTADKATAEIGDSLRYTITVNSQTGALARQTTVIDRLPAGLTYIRGSATVNDQPIADPAGGVGPTLAFNLGPMPASRQMVLRYRVRVGVGALQGDGVNRAVARLCGTSGGCVDATLAPLGGGVGSNEAQHRLRISGGVFAPEACFAGKIFIDCNHNHVQDAEEIGIPGVRLVLSDGTTLISDSEGKYSMCGLPPRSHVLKVDPATLPPGARLTTSSNRNLGDAGSLWLDLKNGELHRADFIEGSCAVPVIEQTKARRAQGEVRAPHSAPPGSPALRFDSQTPAAPTQGDARGTR